MAAEDTDWASTHSASMEWQPRLVPGSEVSEVKFP
jgi:hypothetical protein